MSNLQRPAVVWLWVAVLLCSVGVQGGCGGCGSLDRRRKEMEQAALEAARKEQEEEEALRKQIAARSAAAAEKAAAAKAAALKKKEAQEAEEEERRKPKHPPLPPMLAEWKEEHFFQALASGDQRLYKALEEKAKNPQRSEAEAQMLISLLRPPEQQAATGGSGNQPSRYIPVGDRKTLVRAVAAALAANGTAQAREALGRLLGGQSDAAEQEGAAEGAFGLLLRDESPESQQLVFQAITAPIHMVAASGTSTWDARPTDSRSLDSARQRMIGLVGAEGSRQLRYELARWAVEKAPPGPVRDAVVKMLCEPKWVNIDAQVLLYGSPLCDAATSASLERHMLSQSGEAMAALLELGFGEVGAEAQPRTAGQDIPSVATGPGEKHYAVARRLWNPRFAELVDLRLQAVGSPREASTLVNLAATIPTSAMRERLRRFLNRYWWEGPQLFSGGGSDGRWAVEPGMVPMLKSLQRQNAVGGSVAGGRLVRPGNNVRRPGAATGSGGNHYAMPVGGQSRETAAFAATEAWNRYVEQLVRGLCRRCHLAALQQAAAAHRSGAALAVELAADELPFPQFPGSLVQQVFRIDWPGKHAAQLPECSDDYLRLRYVRLELTGKPQGVAAYYRRQITQYLERPWPEGLWLDSLHLLPEGSAARSVDVILTLPKGLPGAASDSVPLTVEVLLIEIGDASPEQSRTK